VEKEDGKGRIKGKHNPRINIKQGKNRTKEGRGEWGRGSAGGGDTTFEERRELEITGRKRSREIEGGIAKRSTGS